ncbi:hypothetical protein LCGC14_0338100 [marine sediment metagenome]|uniref:Calcineurin-like phosphoesterase domain-containing protein n=1 Tax=marine sediment metagenome TaxID=412755 RepID=A0A0F9W1Q3_9ZZZZ
MELITKELPPSHKLFLVGDFHEGAVAQHSDAIDQTIGAVLAEKDNYVAIMGDLCEAILVADRRYSPENIDPGSPSIILQYQNITEKLRPIKDRILYIHTGNHDILLANKGVGDMVRDYTCRELGVPYGTYAAALTVQNKGKKSSGVQYRAFTAHGWGTLRSAADDPVRQESNMKLSLKRKLKNKFGSASLMAMGHSHRLLVSEPTTNLYLVDEGGALKQRYTIDRHEGLYVHPDHRWYCATGSFLKTFVKSAVTYSERAGFDPTEIGYVVARIEDTKIINVEKVVL